MGNLVAPLDKQEKCAEISSFDLEGNFRSNSEIPEVWPVGGRVFGKFIRDPHHEVCVYSRGPIVSNLYTSKSAVITRMWADFLESKFLF